ncbi:MAG: hypothetical protein WD904_00655 [Dehalococcoidia bacterium]
MSRIPLLILSVLLALTVFWSSDGGHDAAAAFTPAEVDLVAVDMDVAGNTATALGPTDYCGHIAQPGERLTIDVVVDSIPLSRTRGLMGFNFNIVYDPLVVQIASVDSDFLLTSLGSSWPIDFTDEVPDSDGEFLGALADFGDDFETGPGVLARVELEAVAPGASALAMVYSKWYHPDGAVLASSTVTQYTVVEYTVAEIRSGAVSVGGYECNDVNSDTDGVPDFADNCIWDSNPSQLNTDGDAFGNRCDDDDDNDGVSDQVEGNRGSDPLNPLSTPEYFSLADTLALCLDGIDNDLDGFTDGADSRCVKIPPPPGNDDWNSPEDLSATIGEVAANWLGATVQPGERLPCGGISHTLWYKLTAAQYSRLELKDGPHTAIAVYDFSGTAPKLVACDDANSVSVILNAGQTVLIQVTRKEYWASFSWFTWEMVPVAPDDVPAPSVTDAPTVAAPTPRPAPTATPVPRGQ